MKLKMGCVIRTLAIGVLCLSAFLQAAETYGFTRISGNSSANPEGQLFMDVSDAGSNQVLFHFYNLGPTPSSICQIYFDNGTPGSPLVSIADIADSGSGVAFGNGAKSNLPGGNTVGFEATLVAEKQTLSAGSESPGVAPNGVNPPSEWVNLTLNLANNKTFDNTIAALGDGTLRVGLHVQAIGTDGNSDAFVNSGPPTVVPAPGAILLAGIGTTLVGWMRRRRAM